MQELLAGLKDKVGLDGETAQKVIAYLKENATNLPGWLGSATDAVADKLPGGLGKMLGGDD